MNEHTTLKKFPPQKKQWSLQLLRSTKYAYTMYTNLVKSDKDCLKEIKDNFFNILNPFLLSKIDPTSLAFTVLTAEVYSGAYPTLLEQISHAIYRCYVEQKDAIATLIISKKILKKLDVGQSEMVQYTKKYEALFATVMKIQAWRDGERVALEFFLEGISE